MVSLHHELTASASLQQERHCLRKPAPPVYLVMVTSGILDPAQLRSWQVTLFHERIAQPPRVVERSLSLPATDVQRHDVVDRTVGELMDPPLPLVDAGATLDEAFALLSDAATALVVVRGGRPVGIVTKLDLLEYLAHHRAPAS